MSDPIVERIHRALGLPPPGEPLPRRRRDPIVELARKIDDAADAWLAGRRIHGGEIERATPEQIAKAFDVLRSADQVARAAREVAR